MQRPGITTVTKIANMYKAGLDCRRLTFYESSYDLFKGKSLFKISRGFSLRPKKPFYLEWSNLMLEDSLLSDFL